MFGLMSTEQFKDHKSLNSRRRVFYQYPNGAAPLIGLLSLMDTEETDKPEFGWYESRLADQTATTISISAGNGSLATTGTDTPLTAAGSNITENQIVRVWVDDNSKFRTTNVIWLRKVPLASGTTDLIGVITSIVGSTKFEMRVLKAATGVRNTDTATAAATSTEGLTAMVIGTANPEGARSTKGSWTPPKNITNYTQIFRTAFSFTRTALKSGVVFDSTGIYKSKAKDNSLRHMIELEKAFLFGEKQEYIATSHDSEEVPERNTGGVLYFLRQWEAGTAYGVDPATDDDHVNARIIDFDGAASMSQLARIHGNAFRDTNNADFSKLVLCGGGYLGVINEMYGDRIQITSSMTGGDTYGWTITTLETHNGTIYFKTHPLFNQIDSLNYSALYLDVNNLMYRPLQDSDTTLLKNRQENDEDRRKDEWLTEAGLECRNPGSHMFVEGLREVV